MSEEHYYLELCENPVQFENASSVNNVFFDEANKQVFAVRSGGATGVVVKGPEDKSSVAFRMDDKGEVKCIKFSIGNKILAVQRTPKSVVLPDKRCLKLLKSQSINVNWYMYCPETAVILLSTTFQGNVLQPFVFKSGTMSKMAKFEIELPVVPKPAKLNLSERDIAVANIYGQLYVMYLKHHSRTTDSPCAEVVLYHLPREGSCKKTNVLKLNTTGKFALNVVDNLVVVHHQSTQTSIIFDIKLREPDCALNVHQPVLPPRSIHPYRIPLTGIGCLTCSVCSPSVSGCLTCFVCTPSVSGYQWYLQVKLPPTVNLLQDKGKLIDFLLRRRDCKMVILSVCSQMLNGEDKGSLPVVATVFDKLNQVFKEYLEAEQTYTVAMESGPSRGSAARERPVRTQAVIDQSDMYTHVLSSFTEKKDVSHKFIIAVLMEYIRSLNQVQITVQVALVDYLLSVVTLVEQTLDQFYCMIFILIGCGINICCVCCLKACLLLSLEGTYPAAHQLSLDMLKRLSTANDEIVEVLLSKQQVLGALRFIRSVGGNDNISARKFLDAALQTADQMLFYTIFRFFEQRNLRLRGSPSFNPGEHCEEHVVYFKQVFGEQALMKQATV
uniref:Regulator of MON1-CCZ1 n=1 Tax=Salmo trutta TaxID=8032 RepID=A0A674AWT9_SALTR